jgi:hypothetical protein
MRGIAWLAEDLLASEVGLCCMELGTLREVCALLKVECIG